MEVEKKAETVIERLNEIGRHVRHLVFMTAIINLMVLYLLATS